MLSEVEELEMLRLKKRKAMAQQPQQPKNSILNPVGEGIASIASSAASGPVSGLVGLAGAALPGPEGQGADWAQRTRDTFTYQPRSEEGKQAVEAIGYLPGKAAEGANLVGGKVTDVTGSPLAGAAVNAGLQAAPALLGKTLKPTVKGALAKSESAAAKAESLNSKSDAGLIQAHDLGYSVSPNEAGSGAIARTIESLSGEPKSTKLISKGNQAVTNEIIRKDLGIPEDIPITRKVLAQVRQEEGANYEVVKRSGPIATDAKYISDLKSLTQDFDAAAKDFKHRKGNPLQATVKGLTKESFDAGSAVEEVKLLREDANKAYIAGDARLGKKFKDASSILDNLIDRHMQKSSSPEAYAKYQSARTRIAKTYEADKALNDTTGNINADAYAKMMDQRKPLSGGAKQVAEFAKQFPKSSRRSEKMGATGPTIMDLGLASLSPKGLAMDILTAGARPAGRMAVSSQPFQSLFVKPSPYESSLSLRLSDAVVGPLQGAAVPTFGLDKNQ